MKFSLRPQLTSAPNQTEQPRPVSLAATVVVALAALGSLLLIGASQDNPFSSPPLAALGLIALAAALALSYRPGAAERLFVRQARRFFLLALTAPLLGFVLLRVPGMGRNGDFMGVFLAWTLAITLYLLAFRPVKTWPRWRLGVRSTLTLAAITLFAAAVRLWDLGAIPFIFQNDEASFAMDALRLAAAPMPSPFSTAFLSQPTLGMFYEGLALRFTGSTIEGARFLWALLGIVTVPVAFLLASRGGGTKVGLVAAALLAAYHFHIHFSRTALNNIADPFFLAVAVYCLLNAVERKSFFSWAIVGAITGLALYFYQGARLTPVVLAIVLVFWAVRQGRRFRARLGWGPLVALGAFLVSAAPMLQYAVRFPDEFNARVNQISVLQPGWFAQETVRTGLQGYQIMWNQLTHALLAFNIFPDTSPTYKLQTPLLDPLFGLVFLLGLLHSTFAVLVDQRYWRLAPLVIWWWSGVVIGDALTFNPPTSQRMITVAVPVCIFIALALDLLLRALRQLRFNIPPVPALVTSVFLFAVISLKTYFIDYNPQHLAGSKTDDVIMALTPELRALRPQATVLFAGAAAMYWKPPTWTYLAPQATGADLPPLTGPLSVTALKPGQQALFIFLPFRMDDLAFVQQTFPNGVLQTVTDPVDQQVLATTYKVER